MNKDELIKKWEAELTMWRKSFGENRLSFTKEEQTKAIHFASAISAMLTDIKKLTTN